MEDYYFSGKKKLLKLQEAIAIQVELLKNKTAEYNTMQDHKAVLLLS